MRDEITLREEVILFIKVVLWGLILDMSDGNHKLTSPDSKGRLFNSIPTMYRNDTIYL